MNSDRAILRGATPPPWEAAPASDPRHSGANEAARRAAPRKRSRTIRDRLVEWLRADQPPSLSAEEVQAHVQGMPARFWDRVGETDLLWHLNAIHEFLKRLVTSDAANAPVCVDGKRASDAGRARVMVCPWDRRGLLENIAAGFSELRIGVERAEVYTRGVRMEAASRL